MLLSIAALAFLGVALTSYAVMDLTLSDDRRVSRRLQGLTEYEQGQVREAEPMLRSFRERVGAPVGQVLVKAGRSVWSADYSKRVARKLERAGHPGGMDAGRFLAAKVLTATGLLGILATWGVVAGWRFGNAVFIALVAGAVGLFLPDLWLTAKLDARKHRIVRELPDMLDMLTISVEAGLGFDAAVAKLVKATDGPLAQEFGRALQETQAGASRKDALRAMAERVDVPELSAFTASIVQAEIFGISITQVLRSQAADMRLRRRQHAEELAQKAPVKMVIPLVLCILPATMIVVGGPAVMRIFGIFAR